MWVYRESEQLGGSVRTCVWEGPLNLGINKMMVHRDLRPSGNSVYTLQVNSIRNVTGYGDLYTPQEVLREARRYMPKNTEVLQLPSEMLTEGV